MIFDETAFGLCVGFAMILFTLLSMEIPHWMDGRKSGGNNQKQGER
jgi:hypothetical protein